MIVDSSAIVAIVFQEPAYQLLLDKLAQAEHAGMATPTLVETCIVLSARLKTDARPLMYRLLQDGGISEVAFGAEHWRVAVEAYLQYGKRRHPAQLNFGDCLSYATAKLAQMPLLCVGDDFPQTDLALA